MYGLISLLLIISTDYLEKINYLDLYYEIYGGSEQIHGDMYFSIARPRLPSPIVRAV
jgi:hypothetical protein